ncbi:MAG TPA: hypothetical protein PKI27_03630 [Dermatophilaceae bacterium]|nr:hypothetical protein [Dermatophilaceae bacterium]
MQQLKPDKLEVHWYAGDTFPLIFRFRDNAGTLVDFTGVNVTATFTIKEALSDVIENAKVAYDTTGTPTNLFGDANGQLSVVFEADTFDAVLLDRAHPFDVRVTIDTSVYTVFGTFHVHSPVTTPATGD